MQRSTRGCSPMSAGRAARVAHIDPIIAAHAAEAGRLVLTRDARARFSDLPGITAIDA